MDPHHLPLGSRISLNSNNGTVRFVGPVDGTAGIWVGIEWDDLSRGKHDGSKDGKQYFNCRFKTTGSFIRPSANLQYGVSFLDALNAKYVEALHGSGSQEKIVLGSSGGAIEVEAVSLDKIRQKFSKLDHLREVSLINACLVRGDPPGRISQTCPNIRGLDLSQNLFSSWEAVAEITKELARLQTLSLSRNRLQLPSSSEPLADAFQKLQEIQLNDTLLTWTDVRTLMASMPQLRSMELGYNQLTRLSYEDPTLHVPHPTSLRSLNLDSNRFSDWVHICSALKEYQSLERLVLTANAIESIPFLHNQPGSDSLPGIQYVSLSDNRIASWSSIDALSTWLPNLKSLSVSGNPLVNGDESQKHARPFTIARIPSLTTLDGTSITLRERTDSELFYMSHIIQQGHVPEETRREEHYRWAELCEKHGKPNEVSKPQNVQDKLSNHLIDLELYPYDVSMKQKGCTLDQAQKSKLQVLPSMSLRILRMKICKTLKYDIRRVQLQLWLRMWDGHLAELETRDDGRDLDWLGLENDSQIIYQASH